MQRLAYHVVQIDVDYIQKDDLDQEDMKIQGLIYSISFENQVFTKRFNGIKLTFVVISLINLIPLNKRLNQFKRNDLGWVQKIIQYLHILMILFDDPFCIWKDQLGIVYSICQSLFESSFIAGLLFFWLLLMHAIANQDTIISIDPRSFFVPKILISVLFFGYLVTMRLYVYIKYAQDPFFSEV